ATARHIGAAGDQALSAGSGIGEGRARRWPIARFIKLRASVCHEKISVRKLPSGFVPRNPQAPSPKSRLRQRLFPTEEEQKIWPGIETDELEDLAMDSREEKIKRRAHEIWEQEGRPAGREQEHWDQAVQEIEAEGSETERGPVLPDPTVAADSNSLKR
ncbi:DUF2934 domain-containing protein, partial [Mesorhizobium sp. M7A.F.Ca.ET.027.03.2.1]|uniref:DUF2934 domain-containing protein n=3 Tax=Mesorhizobium TaxID=68287 RepID=UPI001FE1C64C